MWFMLSGIASIAAALLLFVFTPASAWTSLAIYSAIILVLAVGVLFLLPFTASRDTNIGILGPVNLFSGIFLITSFATFIISGRHEASSFGYAANILNTAFGLIGFLILSMASQFIKSEIVKNDQRGFNSVVEIELMTLSSHISDSTLKNHIQIMVDEIRFSPRVAIKDDDGDQLEVRIRLNDLHRVVSSSNDEQIRKGLESLRTAIATLVAQAKLSRSKV